jgi:hypothetical protein
MERDLIGEQLDLERKFHPKAKKNTQALWPGLYGADYPRCRLSFYRQP